jgi:hypothetical protein
VPSEGNTANSMATIHRIRSTDLYARPMPTRDSTSSKQANRERFIIAQQHPMLLASDDYQAPPPTESATKAHSSAIKQRVQRTKPGTTTPAGSA